MRKLTFLGTGTGMPHRSSCSSILVQDDTTSLLLDTGGGYDLIVNMFAKEIDPASISNIFISHTDCDHFLGIVPLIRCFTKDQLQRRIFGNQAVHDTIRYLGANIIQRHFAKVVDRLESVTITDRMAYRLDQWQLTFFDLQSPEVLQFGCRIDFPDHKSLVFSGDEPLQKHNEDIVSNCDILIHEAHCLDKDQALFDPHAKNHGTVKKAALTANKLHVKQLIFFHMEDKTLETRKQEYAREAQQYFPGQVFVPIDLDTFDF